MIFLKCKVCGCNVNYNSNYCNNCGNCIKKNRSSFPKDNLFLLVPLSLPLAILWFLFGSFSENQKMYELVVFAFGFYYFISVILYIIYKK